MWHGQGAEKTMDKIIIKNLLARGIIGVNDWEREKPQDILINIEIEADLRQAGESDDIEHTVNYRTVAKKAVELAEGTGKQTVESLAHAIAIAASNQTGPRAYGYGSKNLGRCGSPNRSGSRWCDHDIRRN